MMRKDEEKLIYKRKDKKIKTKKEEKINQKLCEMTTIGK